MDRRIAILLGLALALLLGIAARLALGPEPRPAAAGAPTLEGPAAGERAPALLAGAGGGPARARAEAPAPEAPAPERPGPAPRAEEPERWVLEGRVVGAAPERWDVGQLVLEWQEPFPRAQRSRRRFPLDGPSFTIDVGFLAHDPSPVPSLLPEVGVRLEHPALTVDAAGFSHEPSRLRRGTDGRLERVSTVVLVAHASATLVGRVVDERGAPVAGALVDLLEGPRSRVPDHSLGRALSDAQGEFDFSALAGASAMLLVDAEERRPLGLPIDALAPGLHELGTLVLEAGPSVEGRVEGVGAGFLVVAHADAAFSGEARLGGNGIAWRGSTPMRVRVVAITNEEGLFRMTGLAAEPHHVEVERGSWSEGCTIPGTRSGELAVRPPASGIVLRDESAWLRFELRGAGRTLVDGAKVLALPSESACTVGENMRATWRVPPGRRLTFRAEAFGHAPAEVELVAPGPGGREDVVVELAPLEGGRILVLVRDVTTGEPVRSLRYEWMSATPAGVDSDGKRMQIPSRSGRSIAEDGRHLLGPFEPGRASLGVEGVGEEGSHLVAASLEVDVPANGRREYELALEFGGELVVHLRVPEGRIPGARAVLRDARGAVVGTRSRWTLGHVRRIRLTPDLDDPAASGPVTQMLEYPLLPAGAYTLEIDDLAWQPATIPVRVEAGRTTTVEHVLVPR
jgi:hypothetical protein